MPPDKARLFVEFVDERIGPLSQPGEVQNGTWNVSVGSKGFTAATVHYFDCEFEKAKARVTLSLVRRGSTWQIYSIYLSSDAPLQ